MMSGEGWKISSGESGAMERYVIPSEATMSLPYFLLSRMVMPSSGQHLLHHHAQVEFYQALEY